MNIYDTLMFILQGIVTDNSSIRVEQREETGTLHLEVSADPEIIGQIIGKEGKIIKSIRTILNLSFPEVRYFLEIKG